MKNKSSKDKDGLPRLIGIAGHMRAGKDVISSHLVNKYKYVRIGFADALKEEVLDRFRGWLEVEATKWYGEVLHEGRCTLDEALNRLVYVDKFYPVRELLQYYGTEVRRRDNPAYWTIRWVQKYLNRKGGNVVVSDVRFANEVEILRSWNGHVVKVTRPGHEPSTHHASERLGADIKFDYVFVNDGTIQDLQRQVDTWII